MRFALSIVTLLSLRIADTAAFVAHPRIQSLPNHALIGSEPRQSGTTAVEESSSSSSTALGALPGSMVRNVAAGVGAAAVAGTAVVKLILDRPSRTYASSDDDGKNTVAREYDAWADDGILQYYWGEHIHLGYYSDEEMSKGYKKKDFIQAKYDFIDEMMAFGGIDPKTFQAADGASDSKIQVLDVGCGFGGTSRYIAKQLGADRSQVTGITLSPRQVEEGTKLAEEQDVPNAKFQVMDALAMEFPDNSFDIVWACESGEHMPDKTKYINEMMRVLKPGGTFVMACWSQRAETPEAPFDKRDKRDLQYLYEEWTHPYFISIEDFKKLIDDTGVMNEVTTADWVKETIASWRHSIWVGVYDPRGWIFKPKTYIKCFRDAYCLERMHRAFRRGLMQYGMWTATKKKQ